MSDFGELLVRLDRLWLASSGEWELIEDMIWGPSHPASGHPNGREYIGRIAEADAVAGGDHVARFIVAVHNAWPAIRAKLGGA